MKSLYMLSTMTSIVRRLELDLRGKREYTDIILSAMGGVSKQRLNQYKRLLVVR